MEWVVTINDEFSYRVEADNHATAEARALRQHMASGNSANRGAYSRDQVTGSRLA